VLDSEIDRVNSALQKWKQGDCTIGEHIFVHQFDPKQPLITTKPYTVIDEESLVKSVVRGFVVLTQTCDLVRDCQDRPYLEISPLIEIETNFLEEVRKMKRPQYAYIPGIAEKNLVADLDRVMTVEKSIVAAWERIPGCHNDQDSTFFGQALSRKRSRFAFPNDFNQLTQELQKRMINKHDRNTPEGSALRQLSEIRVEATPSWNTEKVNLIFWFIRPQDDDPFTDKEWSEFLDEWRKLIPPSGRYQSVNGAVKSLEDLTAKEYVESKRLDLDRLSSS
jgi:hypothetical protein